MSVSREVFLLPVPRCGNARPIDRTDEGGAMLEIVPDPVTGTYQWFHFAAHAQAGVPVRIVNAGGSTYPRGWPGCQVWMRPAGGRWRLQPTHYDTGVLSFEHSVSGRASYALFPPYPARCLHRLAALARASAAAEVIVTGDCVRLSIGDRSPAAQQIWVLCGQHGSEHPAIWFAEGLVGELLARKDLLSGKRVHVVPVANPDGMRLGHLRTNADGVDPNRHWMVSGESVCAEVNVLLQAMSATGVDVLLDVHTDFDTGMVYLDVLDEWLDTPSRLSAIRDRFELALMSRTQDFMAGRRYPWTSPPDPHLLASMCAPVVERRFGAAAMTLELPIGGYVDAHGRRNVWTPARSIALGRAAAGALLAS